MEDLLNIPSKCWWHDNHFAVIPTGDIWEQCICAAQTINKKIEKPTEFTQAAVQLYKLVFVHESLRSEKNIVEDISLDIVHDIIMENKQHDLALVRDTLKIKNFYAAYNFIMTEPKTLITIDPKFITDLHRKLMNGLQEHPGRYRTNNAKPQGDNHFYLQPELIESHLTKLCTRTAEQLATTERFWLRLKIVVEFIIEFLDIHPFANGNGRMARLLLAHALKTQLTIPICIFHSSKNVWNSCLQDSRQRTKIEFYSPALCRYVLENAFRSLQLFEFLLNVNQEE